MDIYVKRSEEGYYVATYKIRQYITLGRTYPCVYWVMYDKCYFGYSFFEGKHKTLGIITLFIGLFCLIAANHFKKGERNEE